MLKHKPFNGLKSTHLEKGLYHLHRAIEALHKHEREVNEKTTNKSSDTAPSK